MLRRIAIALCAAAAVATTAGGQSLAERAAEVSRRQQAEAGATRGSVLRAIIGTKITVDFQGTKARDAFGAVQRMLHVDMEVRWAAGPSAGLDPEAPVTLRAERTTGLAVLERMIAQAATEPSTWQLRPEGFLEIGPKSRLNSSAAQETRVEPIRDLLIRAPDFTNAPEFNLNQAVQSGSAGGALGPGGSAGGGAGGGGTAVGDAADAGPRQPIDERAQELIELITSTVEPQVWGDPAVASIRYHDGNLVVRAPDYVLRQIFGYPGLRAEPAGSGRGQPSP